MTSMDKAFTVCAAEQGILKASKSPYSQGIA